MELRSILTPPTLYEDKVRRMIVLADEIIGHIDSGETPDKLIEAFNELTGGVYEVEVSDFYGASEGEGAEEFVRQILTPDAPWVTDISREEYLEIIRRISCAEYKNRVAADWLMSLLNRNLSHPAISDLIFRENNTPEEALEKLLMHKPIAL